MTFGARAFETCVGPESIVRSPWPSVGIGPKPSSSATNIDTDDDLREAVEKLASYVDGLPDKPTVVPIQAGAKD